MCLRFSDHVSTAGAGKSQFPVSPQLNAECLDRQTMMIIIRSCTGMIAVKGESSGGSFFRFYQWLEGYFIREGFRRHLQC